MAERAQACAKDVGHTDVGGCLALFGSVGQRAFAHSRSREVWAAL